MGLLDIRDEMSKYQIQPVVCSVPFWTSMPALPSLVWNPMRMSTTPPSAVPSDKRGVYTFSLDPGIAGHPRTSLLLYVGKTESKTGFRSRYEKYYAERNHTDSDRPRVHRMIKLWFDYLWFCYAEVSDADIKSTEEALISAYVPPCNADFPATISKAQKVL